MLEIHNSETISELAKGGGLQSAQGIPRQLNTQVIPVMECNPRLLRISSIVRQAAQSATGDVTVYTTPAKQDFYMTYAQLSIQKDVVSDNVVCHLTCTMGGATRRIISIPAISLTAGTRDIAVSFPFPIKIDRNTNVLLSGAFTVGVTTKSATIAGYVDEASLL
jgi:hypothetical protein